MKTKKFSTIIAATACVALLGACDMDKYPYNGIAVEEALTGLVDCQNLRSGMYRDLRFISSTPNNFLATEMQADCIVPTNNYGNIYGPQYLWTIAAGESTVRTNWANDYTTIAQCNLLINGIPSLEASGALSAEDMAEAGNILGEAYLIRAMCYFDLATKFCNVYDAATAESEMGVPLVTVYAPSGDNSTYPGRSSLADTYRRITDDIAAAKEHLTAAGEQESIYLTVDALTAFEARVALLTGDYRTAADNARELIDSQRYPLINDAATFANMWKNDTGSELICQLYATQQETVNAMGSYFLDEIYYTQTFLPAMDIMMEYSMADIRFDAYFTQVPVAFSGGTYYAYCINKYPGNPALNSGTNNEYRNKVKIFRIAEMYLVAAEAYYYLGDTDNAYSVLYQLMSARDASVTYTPVGGTTLRNAIRDERLKELCYEGFRWLDLKRYGEGFTRMSSQSDDLFYQQGLNLQISADNPQWLWPIPQDELDANPQIQGQQNPGY